MIELKKMDLQLFAEGGGGDGGAEGGDSGSAAGIRVGDTLEDGTVVDESLASSMRENADMYLTQGQQQSLAQGTEQNQGTNDQQPGTEPKEPTAEEWEEAKKRYAKFFGDDVHAAVNKRFKNQADAGRQLQAMQPMLDVLMRNTGTSSLEELQSAILNDDSLMEKEAEERGMSVESLREVKALEAENEQYKAAQKQQQEAQFIANLQQQEQQMKQTFPDFDLIKEMGNEKFRGMIQMGFSVEDAFYGIHGKELQAQSMAYGVQAGKAQTAKAIQANGMRPVEGASRGGRASVNVQAQDGEMSEEMYDRIRQRTMQGENVTIG